MCSNRGMIVAEELGVAMAEGTRLGAGAWMQAASALGYGVQVRGGDVLQPGEARS